MVVPVPPGGRPISPSSRSWNVGGASPVTAKC